jgi:hypothetical protein
LLVGQTHKTLLMEDVVVAGGMYEAALQLVAVIHAGK